MPWKISCSNVKMTLTKMIAVQARGKLEKKKLICYYAFSFHTVNFPLLAAGAGSPQCFFLRVTLSF